MTPTSPPVSRPATLRAWTPRALVLACAATTLLAACGGSGESDGATAAVSAPEAADGVAQRRFVLWQAGAETSLRAEQARLADEPGSDDARLVVRMNPAALPSSSRAALLGSGGNGEGTAGSTAAAQQAQLLAAKADAVALAADGVMALSIRRLAPQAVLRQQFAHAIEGFVVTVPWNQAQAVADELAANPAVDAVELDRELRIGQAATPARTLDTRAWGVDRIDQRARAFDGLFRSPRDGQGVTVHVVDSGVSPHQQFGTRLRSGFSAVNDGNGTRDCQGHGTHVAGTAAGLTLGVAPGANVVPVRVMDCSGSGTSSQVIAGLDWIAANGSRPGVVNLSLGGAAFSSLDAAAQRLVAAGFTVVAAAGNNNADACTQSPARASGLVAVAASDNADAKAAFSNIGSCVALWAPGTGIASAGIASSSAVVQMSGTSMAAPHVAGAAALLLQATPTASAAQVRQRLLQDATPNLVLGQTGSTTRALLYAGDAGTAAPLPASLPVRTTSITMTTTVPQLGWWAPSAVVKVVNDKGAAVAGVRVAGRYSHMAAELACTTAADGSCTVAGAAVPWGAVTKLGFAVTGLSGNGLADTGKGTRSMQVAQPAAPVASVSALSGSMVRPSASATAWTPQFVVTLTDKARAPVAGAQVQGLLSIHSGARVVGMQTVSCQTAANGQCQVAWTGPTLGSAQTGAVFEVKGVARSFLVYKAGSLTKATVGKVK